MESSLSADLRDLVRLAGAGAGDAPVDDLLRRGLDWLARLAPYDLATIFVLREAELVVRAARGPLAARLPRGHALPLAEFPTIREAIETRRARAYTEHDHAHGDGDPFDGVLDLPPGHSCMIAPLCAGDRCFGVLALDRTECVRYAPDVVNLVEVYAQILAIAIQSAEQRAILERLHDHERARARLLQDEAGGDPLAGLDDSASPTMRELVRRTRQVAATDTPVLILGETGTGKERLARAIHGWSRREAGPFVTLNCAAVPAGLLESELFGHVKGAFSGATATRAGRFQMAHGGTLLLDEIGELPTELQAKLLRVVQEQRFEPVGSDRSVSVDVRLLAATHVDLEAAIAARRFRDDLYYRLAVFPLRLPALRDRLEDLPRLCRAVLAEQARRTGRRGARVTADALARLAAYDWPGNVRELANVLERATIVSSERALGPEVFDLPRTSVTSRAAAAASPPSRPARLLTLADAQREHIRAVLAHTGGKIYGDDGAAKILGVPPSTLQSRMKKLGTIASGSSRRAPKAGS